VANDAVLPEPIDLTETPTSDLRSPTKVQVVIPKKSPLAVSKQSPSSVTASNKKAKRRKTPSDQAESEPAEKTSVVPEVAPAKKKKARGRPKKVAPVPPPVEPEPEPLEQVVEVEHQQEVVQTTVPGSMPEEIEQDSKFTRNDTDDGKSPDATDTTTAGHSKPRAKPLPAAASETPERKIKPTTASPANTAKVPYRVGLSKRARIAPLLRIVKK